MPIDATPDHVAVAVPDPRRTHARWGEQLGGGTVSIFGNATFVGRQYRYANGGKLELVSPNPFQAPATFLHRFLDRFGTRIHHVTLKVPDVLAAAATVTDAGYDVVDVSVERQGWREAFLRPSEVGGLVVQLAWSPWSDEEWAGHNRVRPTDPAPHAASLLGPRLAHPDLDAAARVWELLGAQVDRDGDTLTCRWDGAPLAVVVERGEVAGPVSLRMPGADALPHEDGVGPPVEGDLASTG